MTGLKIGNYRWRFVALLFFATTINYIDRSILGILAPELTDKLGWGEDDYGYIVSFFQAAYAIGLLTTGGILDRIGTRVGYVLAMIVWSIAGIFHAACRSVASFSVARFFLGLGQSANFPAAIKTITEWFPKKERALATGIFNMGSNMGAILTPLLIPVIALKWSWQWAFIITGALGFIWLLFWLPIYRKPEECGILKSAERDYILQDEKEKVEKVPWAKIFPHRQTLGICLARFFTDPIWWFFLFWLPKFLFKSFGIDLTTIGLPLIIIYVVSMGGSFTGGWLSSFFIKREKNPVYSRKTAIFFMALLVVPIFFAVKASNMWIAVLLISMATFAHQGFAANIFTIVSDIYPKNAVASMTGLAGFSGAIGGMLFSGAVGLILEATHNYYIIFGFASIAYLLSWLSLKIFVSDNKKIII
ncbi:MAG: MFS transporter [Bacteroidales bacterium]|nr:MFS transporter [Bacteroidales bacterium]